MLRKDNHPKKHPYWGAVVMMKKNGDIYCVTSIRSDSRTIAEMLMPMSEKPDERKREGRIVCIGCRGNAQDLRQGV